MVLARNLLADRLAGQKIKLCLWNADTCATRDDGVVPGAVAAATAGRARTESVTNAF